MSKGPGYLDYETKVLEAPHAHKDELRLWLRLLTCTNMVQGAVRKRLGDHFNTTLPRFDLLAQLERAPQGMTLGDLSRRMMVTNGNVTGLVERLVQLGFVVRTPLPTDRRVQIVKLTQKGRTHFDRMANAHKDWIAELFSELSAREIEDLLRALGKLKDSVKASGVTVKP
jgi:DNA-binding MarR family transcriptional regulator